MLKLSRFKCIFFLLLLLNLSVKAQNHNRSIQVELLDNTISFGHNVATETKPNILVVLCDDLGYGDLECYGHPHIKTPNLNRLAKEGIRFTDFYSAASVCSPSRVGLLSGRSPNRAGVYDWIDRNIDSEIHIRSSIITIPQLLKEAGYVTCMLGKWHCSGRFEKQPGPGQIGFDYWFATDMNAIPSHKNPHNFVRNGKKVGPLYGYSCLLIVDEALNWLEKRQQRNEKQPFFMYMALHETHTPIASPKDLVEQYTAIAKNKNQAIYYANVANIDAAVGRLMTYLKAMNIDKNTLIIFTSDNGPETLLRYPDALHSYGIADPLRGMKHWTTEGGLRVPGIMRWPARIKANQIVNHPVSSLDFLPTFCKLARTSPPDDLALDGISFLPALDNKPLVRKKPLLWIYYWSINERRVAMRDGDWKIIAKMNIPRFDNSSFNSKTVNTKNSTKVKAALLSDFQIFNLKQDITESDELSESYPEKLEELVRKLEIHYKELVNDSYVWPAR